MIWRFINNLLLLLAFFFANCTTVNIDNKHKVVAAECQHDMRLSVQLPSALGADSKLGLTMA